MVKELSAKLSLASPEVAVLKDELQHAKDECQRQGLVAKETQNILMQRLQLQVRYSRTAIIIVREMCASLCAGISLVFPCTSKVPAVTPRLVTSFSGIFTSIMH